jgi:lauroyl/myristoyl acyltransferase
MPPDSRRVINSSFGIRFAAFLADAMPSRLGYRITCFLADQIALRSRWGMVRSVRANQWIVSGKTLTGADLDEQVRLTFRNTARSIYELHRDIKKAQVVNRLIEEDNALKSLLQRPKYAERGLVVAGLHMSNFDFILQAGFLLGANALVLTLPKIHGGYQQQFEMRRKTGMDLVPASLSGLKRSIEYLKQGGWVLTGMDRPVENPPFRPLFFGQPAALPVHHIYLALKARVPLQIGCALRLDDGSYRFNVSEPLEMKLCSDREEEILLNAEAACRLAEEFICKAPQQWSMSFPVWPEALDQVPHYEGKEIFGKLRET